mmetsp:Transcript_28532/g.67866  ORF Transcript_28532/g.67866 Transcript_28532/m.67866 type:complete len:223 (-) Transcript_28532:1436-2104(-)
MARRRRMRRRIACSRSVFSPSLSLSAGRAGVLPERILSPPARRALMHAASGPCPLRLGPTTMSSLPFPRGARRAVDALLSSEGLPARLQAGALVRAVHSAAAAVRLRRPADLGENLLQCLAARLRHVGVRKPEEEEEHESKGEEAEASEVVGECGEGLHHHEVGQPVAARCDAAALGALVHGEELGREQPRHGPHPDAKGHHVDHHRHHRQRRRPRAVGGER